MRKILVIVTLSLMITVFVNVIYSSASYSETFQAGNKSTIESKMVNGQLRTTAWIYSKLNTTLNLNKQNGIIIDESGMEVSALLENLTFNTTTMAEFMSPSNFNLDDFEYLSITDMFTVKGWNIEKGGRINFRGLTGIAHLAETTLQKGPFISKLVHNAGVGESDFEDNINYVIINDNVRTNAYFIKHTENTNNLAFHSLVGTDFNIGFTDFIQQSTAEAATIGSTYRVSSSYHCKISTSSTSTSLCSQDD